MVTKSKEKSTTSLRSTRSILGQTEININRPILTEKINLNQIKPTAQPVYRVIRLTCWLASELLATIRWWWLAGKCRWRVGSTCGGDNIRQRRGECKRVDDKTCRGICRLVVTLILMRSMATTLFRRDEHNGGLACTIFDAVRKISMIF